jgi:sugar O-acyltransferase (sialic acid O-acetyltransferase NeuD family)
MRELVIFGAGEYAEVVNYYFRHDQERKVAGFVVDDEFVQSATFCERPVVPFSQVAAAFPPADFDAFVAIGYTRLNRVRIEKAAAMEKLGYSLISFQHSRAIVWQGFSLQPNCFILEHNTLQPFTRVGRDVVLWSGNHVGHHSIIGNGCFITSHVVIAGGVQIGDETFVGINSTVRDHVKVGARNVIGAGSIILSDTDDESVFAGVATERSRVPSSRLRRI